MPSSPPRPYKRPESILVLVHTVDHQVLLLKRVDHPDFWQSVTGSLRGDESPEHAAARELFEETGIRDAASLRDWDQTYTFEIIPQWRYRYAPGATHNLEHVFSLEVAAPVAVTLNPAEHSEYQWLAADHAASVVWSWSNRAAIEQLLET